MSLPNPDRYFATPGLARLGAPDHQLPAVGCSRHNRAMIWQQVSITMLTLAAFVLSGVGLLGSRRHALAAVRKMDEEQAVRSRLTAQLIDAQPVAAEERDQEMAQLLRSRANESRRTGHTAAGIKPRTRENADTGREFLAERMIRQVSSSTKTDSWSLGIGLVCGLTAANWSTWAV